MKIIVALNPVNPAAGVYGPQSGDFWKSLLIVYGWTDDDGGLRMR